MYKQIRHFSIFIFSGLLCSTAIQAETEVENLGDYTVTATRVDRSLYDVPAAVGVVDSSDITNGEQRLGLDETLVQLPGIFLQNRYNFSQSLKISIRGFGARANFGTRGVKLYQDGIPLTTVDGQGGIEDIDLSSISRMEVMNGPASSLYGSSSGGVVKFITGNEPYTEPYVEGNYSMGEYQTHIGNIKTGGQIDKLNYFLNLSHLDITGYRDHSRARNTKFNSKFIYDIDSRSDFTTVFTAYDAPLAQDPGGIDQASVDADRRQARPFNVTKNSREDIDQQKLGFTYRRDITPNQELVLRNYYVRRDFLALLPLFSNDDWVEFERFQYGGGAQYNIDNHLFGLGNRTTFGFDIDTQEDDRQRYANNNGVRGALALDQLEQGDSIGVYVRNETDLTDSVTLSVGVRYDKVDLEVEDQFLGNGDDSAELNFEEVSPMGGVLWKINPAVNLYANISSVFETPTFTELTGVAPGGFTNVSAQEALNYEVGVKGSVSPRLNYSLAVFHIDVEDEVINTINVGGRTAFANADTTRDGLEANVEFIPFTGLNVLASYTFNEFSFDSFPASECGVANCEGNELPGLPQHNFYTELSYTHPSGFFSSIDYQYVSNFYVDNENTEQTRPYGVSNLRLGYLATVDGIEITPYLGINNLFDEEYIGNVRINAFGGRYYEPAPELNIYAGLSVRYLY
ncbi:MAG: TonB-dependent receptor [Gammaproteobacteria bacterium]